jgi:hypothetical protein
VDLQGAFVMPVSAKLWQVKQQQQALPGRHAQVASAPAPCSVSAKPWQQQQQQTPPSCHAQLEPSAPAPCSQPQQHCRARLSSLRLRSCSDGAMQQHGRAERRARGVAKNFWQGAGEWLQHDRTRSQQHSSTAAGNVVGVAPSQPLSARYCQSTSLLTLKWTSPLLACPSHVASTTSN